MSKILRKNKKGNKDRGLAKDALDYVPYDERDWGWYEDFIGKNLLNDSGGRATDKASKAADEVGGEGDSYRHALAAAYAVNALQEKGVPTPLAVLGVNALGLSHELTAPGNTLRENFEDTLNNFVGSMVGAFQDDKASELTTKKLAKNILPDGLPQENKQYSTGRYDEMSGGGSVRLKKMSTGGVTLKKGDPPKGTSPYFFNVYPDNNFITADDIARLADEKAGPNAKYTFDEVMSIFAQGESGNKNVRQKGGPAQGEWQMELAARQDAAKYARDLAAGLGLDAPRYSEEDLSDITKLPYEDRKLLAYAYMYGPKSVPTKDVLTGKTPVPQFWMKHWNKGAVDRSKEFGERVSDYLK